MGSTQALVIAVDGPAGVGKSTIAMALARRYGLTYVETGALYRAVALLGLRHRLEPDDGPGLARLAAEATFHFALKGRVNHVLLNGEDVTTRLREEELSNLASACSAQPEVRAALLELQRSFAVAGAVAEGRDIGTVVFPDADYKFFLTATPEERARRRRGQLEKRGLEVDFEALVADIKARDRQDSTRAVAPLKAAADAITVETTDLDLEGVLEILHHDIDKAQSPSATEDSPGGTP